DHNVTASAGGQRPRPLEVEFEQLALVIAGIMLVDQRIAQLPVERVHPGQRAYIAFERRSGRGLLQDRARGRYAGLQLRIDVDDADIGLLAEIADISCERLAEDDVRASH